MNIDDFGKLYQAKQLLVWWPNTSIVNFWYIHWHRNPSRLLHIGDASTIKLHNPNLISHGELHYSDVIMSAMASRLYLDCLLKRLLRRRSKETPKLRVTDLCAGNSPVTGEFPAQRASNAENIPIWWRHHVFVVDESSLITISLIMICNPEIYRCHKNAVRLMWQKERHFLNVACQTFLVRVLPWLSFCLKLISFEYFYVAA